MDQWKKGQMIDPNFYHARPPEFPTITWEQYDVDGAIQRIEEWIPIIANEAARRHAGASLEDIIASRNVARLQYLYWIADNSIKNAELDNSMQEIATKSKSQRSRDESLALERWLWKEEVPDWERQRRVNLYIDDDEWREKKT